MDSLGPYDLGERLGAGGMGVVYRARHRVLDREVALKVIRPELLGSDIEELITRFRREAAAAGRLADHPGIVAARDLGEDAGVFYLAMDLVTGSPLDVLIHQGEVTTEHAVRWIAQAARAVHHAHEQGILHRDLKPANILISEAGDARVTDFGLALHTRLDADAQRLTASNMLVGTPAYMAPEQAGTGAVDGTADVWALGVTLYEALCGRCPFEGDSTVAVLMGLLHHDVPPPRRFAPDLPAVLEAIVLRCLQRDPAQRYPTALALADDCERWLRGEPPHARPSGTLGAIGRRTRRHRSGLGVVGVVVVLAGGLGGAWWAMSEHERRGEHSASLQSEDLRHAEALARAAAAFVAVEETTRASFAALEDRAHGTSPGDAPPGEARAAILRVLDARPSAEQGTTAQHAWRRYLQVATGDLAASALRELADGDPSDPVSRLLYGRAVLFRYAFALELPHPKFASEDPSPDFAAAGDTEAASGLRDAGVQALTEAAATPLWAHLPHGPEAQAMLDALQAIPHADWPLVQRGLRTARDDPWWRSAAELLTGYALAMERRFDEASDVLEGLARRRRWARVLVTAGVTRLDSARVLSARGAPAAGEFERAITLLTDAWVWAPGAAETAATRAAAQIELAALRAESGTDPRPSLRAVVAELDAVASQTESPRMLEMPRARAWLVIAQYSAPRGQDPTGAAEACVAACGRYLQSAPDRRALLYQANAWGALATWQMGTGGDAGAALTSGVQALGQVLALEPRDRVALNDRGTMRLQYAMYHAVRGRDPLQILTDAADDLLRAAAAAPGWNAPVANLTDVYLLRAQWLEAVGQDPVEAFQAAVAQVSTALQADANNPMFHSRRGVIRAFLAAHTEARGAEVAPLRALARADFVAALRLRPDFVEAMHGLADLLSTQVQRELAAGGVPVGPADEGIARLRDALTIAPGTPVLRNALARAHFWRGQVAEAAGTDPGPHDAAALQQFDALVQAFPDDTNHLLNRSHARLAWGTREVEGGRSGDTQFVACLADVDRVLAISPRLTTALHRRGLCLQSLRRFREAVAAFEAVLSADPEHPVAAAALAAAKAALDVDERK